ncbi:Cof-type HAD-IIB family hydrolase [Rufibacter sediminis]|uniref:HAD family phosphatase n=1 Tax=Rufibacter sediminis TaxID=2762756 RepID=A0ABR6VXZ9_9BACT|nr:Cof-type HAD-IIB family hydrolase [Rufibacter sediminis]MBC3542057.1 HAD family phosphatase [Rufibacter sediminis]
MTIRAICTDIDGTLLNKDRELSQRTIDTIQRLDKNLPFIMASARQPSAVRHLQEQLGILHHPMICFNGGYVLLYDDSRQEPQVLDTVQIPASVCLEIAELAQGTSINVSLYQDDNWHAPQDDEWTQREIRHTKVTPILSSTQEVLQAWQAASTGAHKVMCMGPAEEIQTLWEALHPRFGGQLHIYRSNDRYLEIAPKTISKASALKLLLEKHYDFGMESVMAFGDNYNDVEMLGSVGLGIAVGNARDEAKAAAKEVTAPSIEDGVAIAIEKHLLQA